MKDSPLIRRPAEGLDVVLLGSVHTLRRNVPLILREIEGLSPGFVAVELTDPGRRTGSMDVDAVTELYRDRLVCLDRRPDITASRYLCDTPPWLYLRECLYRYACLPLNQASTFAYNYLNGPYRALFGDSFRSFGWSREDARRYIFERDEYMAAQLIDHMRTRRGEGYRDGYAVVVGRRHVAGMAAILDAYASTGDVGSYYAGGRVIDLFDARSLAEPYTAGREEAAWNMAANRVAGSLVRMFFLPAYVLALFLAIAAPVALVAMAIQALKG